MFLRSLDVFCFFLEISCPHFPAENVPCTEDAFEAKTELSDFSFVKLCYIKLHESR